MDSVEIMSGHAAEDGVTDPRTGTARTGTARTATSPDHPVTSRRRVGVLIGVAAVAYALDVISKVVVVATLAGKPPVRVLGSFLQFDYTRNAGAAFSIGPGYTIAFTAVAIGVVVVILRLARKLYSAPWAIALGLLLGGAMGNLTDRVARAPQVFSGHVVDFIEVPYWPVFNMADSAICVGGVLMVLLAFRGLHPDGTVDNSQSARS